MAIRILEIIFFLYFASHIPITLFIDLQALLPKHVYPQMVSASVRVVDSSSTSSCRLRACSCDDSFPFGSWQMYWSGTRPTSRTQWWQSLPCGLNPLFSARPFYSCLSSPLLPMLSSKVSQLTKSQHEYYLHSPLHLGTVIVLMSSLAGNLCPLAVCQQ